DFHVTGVQTCALPICWEKTLYCRSQLGNKATGKERLAAVRRTARFCEPPLNVRSHSLRQNARRPAYQRLETFHFTQVRPFLVERSEERRVGKEWWTMV